jgi:hypothetical protein
MIISSEAAGAPRPLRDQARLEGPGPVPRHVQRHVPDLGREGLRGGAVAGVRGPAPGGVTAFVAQVCGLLGGQATFQYRLDHLREEASVPGQRKIACVHLGHEPVEKACFDHPVHGVARRLGSTGAGAGSERVRVLIIDHGHRCTPQLKRILT